MKNLITLADPKEIHEYVRNLWRTSDFQESHDVEGGYIRRMIDMLAKRPAIFFEMEDPTVEWSQFTTWMGAYALRPDYDTDAVHDLYYLHEFIHGATMEYQGDMSFVPWHRKMCENEMLASIHSEAFVYFELKSFREKSFDFEIWVDRYLGDEKKLATNVDEMLQLVTQEGKAKNPLLPMLWKRRKEVMKAPDPFDFLEMQIHYYAMQNMQWSNIWKDTYREVEAHMASYLQNALEDRQKAVKDHKAWLLDKKGPTLHPHAAESHPKGWAAQRVTPYQEQAEAFAKIVKANKKRQGNEILTS